MGWLHLLWKWFGGAEAPAAATFTCAGVTIADAYDGTVSFADAYDGSVLVTNAYDGTVEIEQC